MDYSIADEFQDFKKELEKLGIKVLRIEKVGNGSMSFHEVFYTSPKFDEVKSVYVERHKIDELLMRFREAYS